MLNPIRSTHSTNICRIKISLKFSSLKLLHLCVVLKFELVFRKREQPSITRVVRSVSNIQNSVVDCSCNNLKPETFSNFIPEINLHLNILLYRSEKSFEMLSHSASLTNFAHTQFLRALSTFFFENYFNLEIENLFTKFLFHESLFLMNGKIHSSRFLYSQMFELVLYVLCVFCVEKIRRKREREKEEELWLI